MRMMRLPLMLAALVVVAACDGSTEPLIPNAVLAVSAVEQTGVAGALVDEAPAVRVLTADGRAVAGAQVLFSVTSGGGTVTGGTVRTGADGVARAGSWQLGPEPGFNSVAATVDGLASAAVLFDGIGLAPTCSGVLQLNFEPGGTKRFTGGAPCMMFEPQHSGDAQYLLLLENMPLHGGPQTGLFPASSSMPAADTMFAYRLRGLVSGSTAPVATLSLRGVRPAQPAPHSWDFGAGRIYEYEPPEPLMPPPPAALRAADGTERALTSPAADPQVGDTVYNIRLEGIPRLGTPTRNDHRAVIRHVSPELIIAEDVRLDTLTREGGQRNTPLTEADLTAIAAEYASNARVQSDRLFDGRHNSATEASSPPRVLAVHTLMYADRIWGYTYSATNYFAFDFWVGTDGATRGHNQHPQRVADNLFMHEVAHMRHWGLLQRNGLPPRGNRWLVEGFARFTERLPIASRLLGTEAPSRTANVTLPRNPVFGTSYFRDDVPTFLNAGTSIGGGYQHSSYVFDYFADQVAHTGGDWLAALRELVVAAGRRETADPVVNRWLPGLDMGSLFTRARIALYADDIGSPGLPPWTQYHQYQLRSSRPAGSQEGSDPRNSWVTLKPSQLADVSGSVDAGAAVGFLLDGVQANARALYVLDAPARSNVVVSITRIR